MPYGAGEASDTVGPLSAYALSKSSGTDSESDVSGIGDSGSVSATAAGAAKSAAPMKIASELASKAVMVGLVFREFTQALQKSRLCKPCIS